MEETKLQALHDTLSKLRGRKGLGTNSQYSWQKQSSSTNDIADSNNLPRNALYAHFVPEGTYDPNKKGVNDGDGRFIKRNFSSSSDSFDSDVKSTDNRKKSKNQRKEEKKAAAKVAKLEAKRQAKIEEKKRLKKEARRLKNDRLSSKQSDNVEASYSMGINAKETYEKESRLNGKDSRLKNEALAQEKAQGQVNGVKCKSESNTSESCEIESASTKSASRTKWIKSNKRKRMKTVDKQESKISNQNGTDDNSGKKEKKRKNREDEKSDLATGEKTTEIKKKSKKKKSKK